MINDSPSTTEEPPPRPAVAAARPLVIDIDHSLLRTDLLYETFWRRMAANALSAVAALFGGGGKAGMKRRVAAEADLDAGALPVHPEVLRRLRAAQTEGRDVAFASASDRRAVEALASHFGVSRVFASDGETNLKGPAKAAALCAAYGPGGFDYVGDSEADFAVWDHASGVLIVDPAPAMLARAQARYPVVEPIEGERPPKGAGLRAMRPHQWAKNLLVFLPVLAAHSESAGAWAASALSFLAFSACASGLYLINDMLDLDTDRRHAAKRHRAIAAGHLPIRRAMVMAAGLLALGVLLAGAAGPLFLAILGGYLAATLLYSGFIKRIVLIDLVLLAGFYVTRALGGAVASETPLSWWFVAFCCTFFFALAAVKRQTELSRTGNGAAKIAGRGYSLGHQQWVSALGALMAAASVGIILGYAFSPSADGLYERPWLLSLAAALCGAWLARVLTAARRGEVDDDPVTFALRDRPTRLMGAAAIVVVIAAML